jgi:hypothetical protein
MDLRLSSPLNKYTLTKLVSDLFRNLLVIYIILFMLSYLSPGYVEFYTDPSIFLYPLIVLGTASLLFYAEGLEIFDWVRFDNIKKSISYALLKLHLNVKIKDIAPAVLEWRKNIKLYLLSNKYILTKLVSDLFRNLLVMYIILLMLSYISPGYVDFYIDLNTFLNSLIVLGAASLFFYAQYLEISDRARFDIVLKGISYAFLGLLTIFVVETLVSTMQEWGMTQLIVAVVALGTINFYLNREKLNEIEGEAKQEESEEKNRDNEFAGRYPRINSIWGVRGIVRLTYKEGWWYGLLLFAFFIISFILRIWDYNRVPSVDEFDHLIAAKALLLNGETAYQRFPFLNYMIMAIIKIFGENLFWIRIPFILAGSLTTLTIYFLGKKLNKKIGLISAYLWMTAPWAIFLSIYIREYIIFNFFGTLILLFILKQLNDMPVLITFKKTIPLIILFLVFIIPFDFIKAFTSFNLLIVILIVPILTFILIKIIYDKKYKYENEKILILLPFIALIGLYFIIFKNSNALGLNVYFNTQWIKLFLDPFTVNPVLWYSYQDMGYLITLFLIIALIFFIKNRLFLTYFLIMLGYLIPFVFLFRSGDWFAPRYVLYSFPSYIIWLSAGIYLFYNLILKNKNRLIKYCYSVFILILLLQIFNINNTYFALNEPYQISDNERRVDSVKNLNIGEFLDYINSNITANDTIVTTYFNKDMLIWYKHFNVSRKKIVIENGVPYDTSDNLFNYRELKKVMVKKDHGWIILLDSSNKFPRNDFILFDRRVKFHGKFSVRYDIYEWFKDE